VTARGFERSEATATVIPGWCASTKPENLEMPRCATAHLRLGVIQLAINRPAVPYFRVFNPVLQGGKFDSDGVYVRRWVP
jgi:hypothetical protein